MIRFDLAAVTFAGGALIGATSIGAWLWARGELFRRSSDGQATRDLAMQSVLAIDDFVGACYIAAHDLP